MSTRPSYKLVDPAAGVASADGSFKRQVSQFRQTQIPPEDRQKNRYILYANLSCPWAGRTLITRSLLGLEDVIDVSLLHHSQGSEGWYWPGDKAIGGVDSVDPVQGFTTLKQVYLSADPEYKDRYTVPVLYDKQRKTIVNNESSEIIRIFNDWAQAVHNELDLYPEKLRSEIDEINEWIYEKINNGVYKAGFATTQEQYDLHAPKVFQAFSRLDDLLGGINPQGEPRDYLVGAGKGHLTEADVRLFVTIVRFDAGYSGVFRLNYRRIKEHVTIHCHHLARPLTQYSYRHLHRWLRNTYDIPAFKKWVNLEAITKGSAPLGRKLHDQEIIVPYAPSLEDILKPSAA